MFTQKHRGTVTCFYFCLLVSAALSIIMTRINTGAFLWMPIFITFIEAFLISFMVSSILPIAKWGCDLALKLKLKPNSFIFILISNIPVTTILVLILSFCLTALNLGFSKDFMASWLQSIPISLTAVYTVSVIITPLVNKLVEKNLH